MRFTIEEHPDAIRRYAHLKRVRGFGSPACMAVLNGTGRACTRARGHRGPHAAHARFGRLVAVWESGPSSLPSASRRRAESGRRRSAAAERRPVGLRERDRPPLVVRIGRALAKLLEYPEEIALVLMFLAFVWFGIDWLLIIFR